MKAKLKKVLNKVNIMTYSNFSDKIKSELDNYIFYTQVTGDDIVKAYELHINTGMPAIESIELILKNNSK